MIEEPRKLMNRNFFLLWQGQLVSQIGSQAFFIAMMFWLKRATNSATMMGLIMMVSMLPSVILGPIGGVIADRHSRRLIIIISDALKGIAVLSLAGLMFWQPEETNLILAWLFVVAILGGVVSSFFTPAISASIPDLVPKDKVAAANSLNQFSVQISMFIGQGTGGILFKLLGAPVLFLVDGVTYIFSAISECFIRIPQVVSKKNESGSILVKLKKDILEGFHYIWQRAGLRNLVLVFAFLNFFLTPIGLLLPFYVEDFLMTGPEWFGFLLAAIGLGSMLGYFIAGTIKFSGQRRSNWFTIFLFLECISIGLLGSIHITWQALILIFIIGVMSGVTNIIILTILQVSTPSEIRGRVFGFLGTLTGGLTPIAMGLTGVITDMVNQNIPLIYLACGIITALASIITLNKESRRFLAYEVKDNNS